MTRKVDRVCIPTWLSQHQRGTKGRPYLSNCMSRNALPKGRRGYLPSLEVLEDRVNPSSPPALVVPLPAVSGVLHITLEQTAVVLSKDDGTVLNTVSWPGKSTLQLVGAGGGDGVAVDFGARPFPELEVPAVQLVGGQGANSVVVTGTTGNDRAWLQDAGGFYRAGRMTLQMQNLQNIQLIGQ